MLIMNAPPTKNSMTWWLNIAKPDETVVLVKNRQFFQFVTFDGEVLIVCGTIKKNAARFY
jgi:hypothetical protein